MKTFLLRFSKTHRYVYLLIAGFSIVFVTQTSAQEDWSVAREWNEELLFAITQDFARPTIHARNLFNASAIMYDCWAAYDPAHDPWLLGKIRGVYNCAFDGVDIPADPEELKSAREEALSHAMYRFISHRYLSSPGFFNVQVRINNLMAQKGYNVFNTSQNYVNGGPAELGNYIAQEMINFGFTDGSNEVNDYGNVYYEAQNDTIFPESPGNPTIIDPNLWQPISLSDQVDQAGNPIFEAPPFLSPEWGNIVPFALTPDQMDTYERDGHNWNVYMDSGTPPLLDPEVQTGFEDFYKWGFMMVSVWQSHLDPVDETTWDISPATMGNIAENYPTNHQFDVDEYNQFYDFLNGGEMVNQGYEINPSTGMPYEPQLIKRADYARVLAEFWADGPESYTPPGHWYEMINRAVLDHPDLERKWMGEGDEVDPLEWDVKMYFTLGGSMHDAAIAAWSIKGYYDYIRPVSAIRYMCDQGQSSDTSLSNYSPAGAPLLPGYIEVVEEGDPLAGEFNQHVGKIKLYTWRGPDYIDYEGPGSTHPNNDAGVGWILGENWWPYQRPSFVSPPFAGYISGHSTYSSTAAEVMERITGDPFWPGGMGEFEADIDFLEFEVGPSEPFTLQWATYRDASDQCSLSRIWGGIHPPQDDIPGRYIGIELGEMGVDYANALFDVNRPVVQSVVSDQPFYNIDDVGNNMTMDLIYNREMNTAITPTIFYLEDNITANSATFVNGEWIDDFTYRFTYELLDGQEKLGNIKIRISNARDTEGVLQNVYLSSKPFVIDTDRPDIVGLAYNETLLNDNLSEESNLIITIEVDEEADISTIPEIEFMSAADLSNTLFFIPEASNWIDELTFEAHFTVIDNNQEINNIGVTVSNVKDESGNGQNSFSMADQLNIDTRNPELFQTEVNNEMLNIQAIGNSALVVTLEFDEEMDLDLNPSFSFVGEDPLGTSLNLNNPASFWVDNQTYQMSFNLTSVAVEMFDIVIALNNFKDMAGNNPSTPELSNLFSIDTQRPEIAALASSSPVISDSDVGTNGFQAILEFNEPMDTEQLPVVALTASESITGSVAYNPFASQWLDEFTYEAAFNVTDENIEVDEVTLEVSFGRDASGNVQNAYDELNWLNVDTRNPLIIVLNANTYTIENGDIGDSGFNLLAIFDESMNTSEQLEVEFSGPPEVSTMLSVNDSESAWINSFTYQMVYDVADQTLVASEIDVLISAASDMAGNEVVDAQFVDYFSINTSAVGIDENDVQGISFFPNPVNSEGVLRVKTTKTLNDASLHIVSLSGKVYFQSEYARLEPGILELPLGNMASGLYLVQLISKEGIIVHKMMVTE